MNNRFEACDSHRLVALLELEPDFPDTTGSGFIARSAAPRIFDSVATPQIDGYEITGRLGEGGMGVVWRARQVCTHREVALKVRPQHAAGASRARLRFEREIELAARLEHPHIARVYDGGTCHGLDYYAMELIEGVHLDQYVREHKLTPQQILALMRGVCLAVHYAHQRGVIHRDIKPSNVLVSADGHAHVVDFGLAKALEEESGDPTLTQEGQYAGTPAFMSPEQASGKLDRIDTRTDVWGLGATLYVLLTGNTPHDTSGPRYEVIRRVAGEEVRPPRKMNNQLDAELESLLLKALDHDPEQRYGSADDLAQDLDRYLRGDPLEASAPSQIYRLRKLARKYRIPIGIAASFVLLLVAATVVSTWQAVRATTEKHRADEQAAIAQAVNEFFNWDVLSQSNILGNASPPITVRAALDRAGKRITGEFRDQPLVESAVRYAIGNAYLGAREMKQAREHLEIALQLARQTVGEEHPSTLKIMTALAKTHAHAQANPAKAEQLLEDVLQIQIRTLGEQDPESLLTMTLLADVCQAQKKTEKVTSFCSTIWKNRQSLRGRDRCSYLALINLVDLYDGQARHAEVESILLEALDNERRLNGDESPRMLELLGKLGWAQYWTGQQAKAHATRLEVLEGSRRLYGELGYHTLHALDEVVRNSRESHPQQVIALVEPYLSRLCKALGDEHTTTLHWKWRLGTLYTVSGQLDKAEPLLVQTLSGQRKVLGEEDPATLETLRMLSAVYWRTGRLDQAEALCRDALPILRKKFGDDSTAVEQCLAALTDALHAQGKTAEIDELWRQRLELWEKELASAQTTPQRRAEIYLHRYRPLMYCGKVESAKASCRMALALPLAADRAADLNHLAWELATSTELAKRDPTLAVELAQKAVELAPDNGDMRNTLGVARYRTGDYRRALSDLEQSAQLRNGGDGADFFFLAMAHQQLGDSPLARQWYQRGNEWMQQQPHRDEEFARFHAEAQQVLSDASATTLPTQPR